MDFDSSPRTARCSEAGQDLKTTAGLLALMSTRGVGPRKAVALAHGVESIDRLTQTSISDLSALVGGAAAKQLLMTPPRLQEASLPPGLWAISYFDHAYPKALRTLDDPPAVLWGRGAMVTGEMCVAIIGSRNATPWAATTTRIVAQSAVSAGLTVVSGLALGVDTVAHEACLDAGGRTVAILGNGVDVPYPSSNRPLADRILEAGGTLLAEVPPGTRVSGRNLVARDRLQSGLSLGTVVVQTGVPGGTLHTARFTIEQGRVLAVVVPYGDSSTATKTEPYAGNLALASESGADPEVLRATGKLAESISRRKPIADFVLRSTADLPNLWKLLHSRQIQEGQDIGAQLSIQDGGIRP